MFGGMRRLPALVAVALLGAAISGCGSDDDTSAAKQEVRFSEATESPRAFTERLAKLLATTTSKKDCAQIALINSRSTTQYPCPAPKDLRKSLANFKVVGAEEYGTGAIVDYTSGESKTGAAIVLSVALDRNWGVNRFGVITAPSTGTSAGQSRAGYEKAVDSYLSAVRKRDCDAFSAVAFTNGLTDKQEICKRLFVTTNDLTNRLRANPSAKPSYQGGNATYGFYGLETKKPKPRNSTISVVKEGAGAKQPYVVLDVTASPTAATQREAREAVRKGKRDQSDTTPSSKPSDPAVND